MIKSYCEDFTKQDRDNIMEWYNNIELKPLPENVKYYTCSMILKAEELERHDPFELMINKLINGDVI